MLFRSVNVVCQKFGFHRIDTIHAFFDGPDGFEVFRKFPLVAHAQTRLQSTRTGECQVRDISVLGLRSGTKEPVVDFSRISHGGCNMPRSIPGHVIEVDGLNIVFVIVAAKFECRVRRRLSNMIGHNMIKGARQRIG